MKKTASFLLSLLMFVCLFGNVVADEDFQLHNGIVFGDTLEIVKSKEEGTLTIQSGSVDKINNVWFDGTIAGMDASVRFDFNEETGFLTDMLYDFKRSSYKDSIDSDYTKLYNSLSRKYGTPLGNTGGSLYVITGEAINNFATTVALYKYLLKGDGDVRDYDEWIVKSNGYNVKIDLVSYYYRDKDYNYYYANNVSYHYYTDEDLIDALNEKQEENDAMDNDL